MFLIVLYEINSLKKKKLSLFVKYNFFSNILEKFFDRINLLVKK